MKKYILETYMHNQEILDALKKEQKAIKEEIINQMKKSVESVGKFTAIVSDCERNILSKALIIEDYGEEFIKEYSRISRYKKLEIKKAA